MRQIHYRGSQGFTVIEMMITVVIATVLVTVIVPGFNDMLANNRMRSEVYELRASLTEARSEAMTEREHVTVCHSEDGATCSGNWNDGYIAFFDPDKDGVVDDGERIVLSNPAAASSIHIAFDNDKDRVLFNSRGNALDVAAGTHFDGTFTFCDQRGEKKAAGLVLSEVGVTSAAVDTDRTPDDIINDEHGDNLACP